MVWFQIGRTALQRAAAEGHVSAVQLLLQHGADPNKQDHAVTITLSLPNLFTAMNENGANLVTHLVTGSAVKFPNSLHSFLERLEALHTWGMGNSKY